MTPLLVFDIETVPDTKGLRRLHGLEAGLSELDVAEFAYARRRIQTGHDFLPPHLQRVVAISCVLRDGPSFRVWSLGGGDEDEAELIQRFYDGIERYTPQLISWNGSGFDLPVLHYRSMIHGLNAARYWDLGEDDRDFRYNNYISRYHTRHLDLMDLLALYNGRNFVPLDEMAQLIGLPGKLGMDGSKVWAAFASGEIHAIRNYCETDVVNTYLVYLRFQLMRGHMSKERHDSECTLVRESLARNDAPHWKEFLTAWSDAGA
jgi:predicted PolB exonuclease-like 3'-5' exonuclease